MNTPNKRLVLRNSITAIASHPLIGDHKLGCNKVIPILLLLLLLLLINTWDSIEGWFQMGLVVYWYDFVCFGVVGVSFVGALYVIWRMEGAGKHCKNERSMYESLLAVGEIDDVYNANGSSTGTGTSTATAGRGGRGYNLLPTNSSTTTPNPKGHVSSAQLWTSCWRGLHPVYLLGLRFAAFLITTAFLAWDIIVDGPSVLVYYTEYVLLLPSFLL